MKKLFVILALVIFMSITHISNFFIKPNLGQLLKDLIQSSESTNDRIKKKKDK